MLETYGASPFQTTAGAIISLPPDCQNPEELRCESDMDGLDLVVCLCIAAACMYITTSVELEKWLVGVPDAASGKSGDYDFLQRTLGELLYHKGDNMDVFSTRKGDDPWRVFHRLFFGHDPLSFNHDVNDNPFYLMYEQQGMPGIVQASRHLIADTCSKQGLPLPGSSHLDYTNENGRPWNYILDLVQGLSVEVYGDKLHAEEIYEHLATIRAQDVEGGLLAQRLTDLYLSERGITDVIRVAQIRLLAYSLSFWAESMRGVALQHGIPYINYKLAAAMAKAYATLLRASNRRTMMLAAETDRLVESGNRAMNDFAMLEDYANLIIGDSK